jgi:hypothetical protein
LGWGAPYIASYSVYLLTTYLLALGSFLNGSPTDLWHSLILIDWIADASAPLHTHCVCVKAERKECVVIVVVGVVVVVVVRPFRFGHKRREMETD